MIFVGECRSLTAQRKGWTWKDGRLAAKPLFEALRAMNVDPAAHDYVNLWTDSADVKFIPPSRIGMLRARRTDGIAIVALGKRVSKALARLGIDHVALVHPAARGKIRKREHYIAHVAERLAGVAMPRPKPRRKHSRDGRVRCDLCSPLRCELAP